MTRVYDKGLGALAIKSAANNDIILRKVIQVFSKFSEHDFIFIFLLSFFCPKLILFWGLSRDFLFLERIETAYRLG